MTREQLDDEMRRAGFSGYEGCPVRPECPTLYLCSERGDCPKRPTEQDR